MGSNVTGGIILFLVGALLISMGVSEKGKRIFNILTDNTVQEVKQTESMPKQSGGSTNTPYGFTGEKGAIVNA